MAYNLQQMRDHVRFSLDVDNTDIPDSILDQWVREGWQRVHRRLRRWSFLEKQATFNTVGGTASYLYTAVAPNLDVIVKLTGPTRDLRWVSIENAEAAYPRNTTSQGEPRFWTRWAKGVRLWPTPSAVYTIDCRYYESPIEWVSGGGTSVPSQLPDEFHGLIMQWALMRAHAQQEDLDLSSYQKAIYDQGIDEMKRTFEHEPIPQPLVIGGRKSQNGYADRLDYPFE